MIAHAEPIPAHDPDFEEAFSELLERLNAHLRFDPDPEELVAEAIALAWKTRQAARKIGKAVRVGTLAFYAACSARAGRSITGSTSRDALSRTALARSRRAVPQSLPDPDDSPGGFRMLFGDRRCRWPVPDLVAACLDFQDFIARQCDPRDRQIIDDRLAGLRNSEIADRLGISRPAVSQRLRALERRWHAQAVA